MRRYRQWVPVWFYVPVITRVITTMTLLRVSVPYSKPTLFLLTFVSLSRRLFGLTTKKALLDMLLLTDFVLL